MSENRSRDFSMYDEMSTMELEEILRADFEAPEGEETDMDIILYVTDVLTKRRLASGPTGKTALEAYKEFEEHYMPEKMKHTSKLCRWVRTLTTAAAAVLAIVIIGTVSADAFGFNFWQAIARWTQETFHFGDEIREDREPGEMSMVSTESLQEAMSKRNDDPSVVPSGVPEGFELVKLMVDENPKQRIYTAMYGRDERQLQIVVQTYIGERPQQLEQSEDVIEVYERYEKLYYIMSNNEKLRVVWLDGIYECYISGDVTIEELRLMIDSIKEG